MTELRKGDEVRIVELDIKSKWIDVQKDLVGKKAKFISYGGPYNVEDNKGDFISCELTMITGRLINRYTPLDRVKIEKVE